MSDTSKGSPGSNPSKGGQDQRRNKGRNDAPAAASPATPAPGTSASSPSASGASASGTSTSGPAASGTPTPGATGPAAASVPLKSGATVPPSGPTTPAQAAAPAPDATATPSAGAKAAEAVTDTPAARPGSVPPGGNGPVGPRSAPPPPPPPPPPRRDRDRWILPAAAGIGLVVLLGAWAIVASRPVQTIDPARLDALETRLNALAPLPDRLARVEGQGPALQRADQRLGALETALREREPVSLEALNTLRSRLDRQEGALADQQRRADAQIAESERALAQRITGAEAQLAQRVAAAEAALAPKLSALEGTVQQRLAAAEQAARQQADTLQQQFNTRFTALEQREARIVAAEQRLNRLVASTAISTALEAGKPLGAALAGLPGTPPPALERYSTAAPPTMASLRLSFEEAARAARAAAEPATEGQGVLEAAATRLSNLVTIRRGETVVWGDAVSGELEGARQALNAGDIAAAVQKVEGLPEAVRAPMAGWIAQAKGLMEARGALGELMAAPRGQG